MEGRATHLVCIFDGDLEAAQDLPRGWVLEQGQLEPGLGPAFSVEHRWVVVDVHDPDGDGDRGLGSGAPCSADLSHLGMETGALVLGQADPGTAAWPTSQWSSLTLSWHVVCLEAR